MLIANMRSVLFETTSSSFFSFNFDVTGIPFQCRFKFLWENSVIVQPYSELNPKVKKKCEFISHGWSMILVEPAQNI